MNREELDVMWHRATNEAIKEGCDFTRYKFAEMVIANVKSDQIQRAYEQGCKDMERRYKKRMDDLEGQLRLCREAGK